MAKNKREEIEAEIKLIQESMRGDSMDYSIQTNFTLTGTFIIVTFLIGIVSTYKEYTLKVIPIFMILAVIFLSFMFFFRLRPLEKSFNAKYKMIGARYEKLGIDLKSLYAEFDRLKKTQINLKQKYFTLIYTLYYFFLPSKNFKKTENKSYQIIKKRMTQKTFKEIFESTWNAIVIGLVAGFVVAISQVEEWSKLERVFAAFGYAIIMALFYSSALWISQNLKN